MGAVSVFYFIGADARWESPAMHPDDPKPSVRTEWVESRKAYRVTMEWPTRPPKLHAPPGSIVKMETTDER